MKRKYSYKSGKKTIEREYSYIPVRYIIAMILTVVEICLVIGTVAALCYFVPYFYVAAFLTAVVCVLKIIASDDNPDYKVPWLLFVIVLPVGGFMLYLMFYSRKLTKRQRRRMRALDEQTYVPRDGRTLDALRSRSTVAYGQAKMLSEIAKTELFSHSEVKYLPEGEQMWRAMLTDLNEAKSFILMEYFIIEEGEFWGSILEILKKKVNEGVDVKVIFDDVGCMSTLPGNYAKRLRSFGIDATVFSKLRGQATGEFNNRSHRKITVIDGKVAYTGGVNIADEYVGRVVRFGHWKDGGVRVSGDAVREFTRLFLVDFGANKRMPPVFSPDILSSSPKERAGGFVIPFGDGPRPAYEHKVARAVLKNMLASAERYVYMSTPYLILDNELLSDIEGAAMRGIDVRIVVPHVPDKRLVFELTRSFYHRLLRAGVKIYEYTPGFIHLKAWVGDGKYAVVGTANLDYRSLAHHFENGVWLYECPCIRDIAADFSDIFKKSRQIEERDTRIGPLRRTLRTALRIFAPLM